MTGRLLCATGMAVLFSVATWVALTAPPPGADQTARDAVEAARDAQPACEPDVGDLR